MTNMQSVEKVFQDWDLTYNCWDHNGKFQIIVFDKEVFRDVLKEVVKHPAFLYVSVDRSNIPELCFWFRS